MNKIIIAGASGMIGGLILESSLNSPEISEVISLVRRNSGTTHKKLREVEVENFKDLSNYSEYFKNVHAAFFCIGVYTGQVPDILFREITIDYAVEFAKALHANSPNANFCLLSGQGADRTEKSSMLFAKYKGAAEKQISAMGFNNFHTFRPAYIYPVVPRDEPNFTYKIFRFIYPVVRLFGNGLSIKSTELATSMFEVGMKGHTSEILENAMIIKLYRGKLSPK